jgi:hypothetical protein
MIRQIYSALALATLACGVCAAADIDGKWSGQLEGKSGEFTQTLSLKANGTQLTGALVRHKKNIAISEGTINGNNVSFKIVHENKGGKSVTQQYKGTLAGDQLKLTISHPNGKPRDVVYKRAK